MNEPGLCAGLVRVWRLDPEAAVRFPYPVERDRPDRLGTWASIDARLWMLAFALAGLAVLLAVPLLQEGVLPQSPFTIPWWAMTIAFMITEAFAVHLESRGEAHAITFTEIPFVAGLMMAAPDDLLIGRVLAGVLVLGLLRRQSIHKLVINLGLFAAEAALAITVYRAVLGTGSATGLLGWVAAFAAMLSTQVLATISVTIAIWIFSGWAGRAAVQQVAVLGAMSSIANTSVGLAVVISLWQETYVGVLMVTVIAVLFVLYRRFVQLTEQHKNLATLHGFTRSLGGSEIAEIERAVVLGAREILRAEHAALLLPPLRDGTSATRVLALGDVVTHIAISREELASDLERMLPDGLPRLYTAGEPLPGWLGELGVKDTAMVPLRNEGGVVGALVVSNRLTEVSSFVADDLVLFETLANLAQVALENGRLVEALKHDAREKAYQFLHDPVTGLPNRASLEQELDRAIRAAQRNEQRVGLLFVDLDTFSEVSDTLGIATAESVLVSVRDRLSALLPGRAQLLRFTGDQFAVLMTGLASEEAVLDLAELIRGDFDTPFTADTVSLVLGASLGVALYPDHARDADTLLTRAYAATYTARAEGSGIEVYSAEADPYAPRRLALAAELAAALETGEVDVYLQPKVSLPGGMVVGAEALVRWTHPRLGPLGPDQFIPAAEHTGVIRQLTLYVVKEALAQCRIWRDAGLDLTISVNLSARNLFDTHLVQDIGEAIDAAGVPAASLTLELTESTVMGGSSRSMLVLNGLHSLGVGLSVDDFGTGYSSLTHLRNLPVTELKIDKSFVMTMMTNDQDAVIVRALVDLGQSLGLRTVAEGVESPDALAMLTSYQCDEAQGYLISRPLPADQFHRWLARQPGRRIDHGSEVVPFQRDQRRRAGEFNQ